MGDLRLLIQILWYCLEWEWNDFMASLLVWRFVSFESVFGIFLLMIGSRCMLVVWIVFIGCTFKCSKWLQEFFHFVFKILLELGMKFWKLSWSLEDESLVSWEVWGFWVVLEWDACSVCEFKLIMMVFYFWMQLDVRCVWVDGVNKGFKFLRCKGKFLFWEWCAHWVVKLF